MPVSAWRTRTGVYRNSGHLSIDVEAYPSTLDAATDSGIPDPIDVAIIQVEFTITRDGGAPSVVVVRAPRFRRSDYSDAASPLTGVVGQMAYTFLYGLNLEFSSFTEQAVITADVMSLAGTFAVPGGPIIVYRADSSSRPNNSKCYVNYDVGNDAALGEIATPFKTLKKAVDWVASQSGDRNCGGGEIEVQPCELLWFGNGSLSDWYTSDHWPLTILFQDGVMIRTKDDGTESPIFGAYGVNSTKNRNYIRLTGSGGPAAAKIGSSYDVATPLKHPLIWTGYRNSDNFGPGGWGAAYYCEIWLWIDGIRCGSQYWQPGRVSIRFDEKTEPSGLWVSISGADASWKKWGSCLRVEGASDHIIDFQDAHDCVASECSILFFGGSTSDPVTHEMSYSLCNVVAQNMRIGVEEERGYVDVMALNTGDFVASTQSGGTHTGKLRIDCATDDTWGTNFADILVGKVSTFTNFEEVIGAQRQGVDEWYCFVRNWATVEAQGPHILSTIYFGDPMAIGYDEQDDLAGTRFKILEVGLNGSSRPYIILDAAGVSSSSPAPYTNPVHTYRQIRPRIFSGNFDLTWAPHGGTDHMFQAPNKLVDSIRSNVAIFDTDGTQGPFMEVVEMRRVAFVNYNHYSKQASGYSPDISPGIYYCPWSHDGMLASEVVIAHCSWGGLTYFNPTQTWQNCLVVNNVFRELSTDGPQHGVNGCVVSNNSFQVGTVKGVNTNLDDATHRSYLIEPVAAGTFAPSNYSVGLSVYPFPYPRAYAWPNAIGAARGALPNAGMQDWSLDEPQGTSAGQSNDIGRAAGIFVRSGTSDGTSTDYALGTLVTPTVKIGEAYDLDATSDDQAAPVGVKLSSASDAGTSSDTAISKAILVAAGSSGGSSQSFATALVQRQVSGTSAGYSSDLADYFSVGVQTGLAVSAGSSSSSASGGAIFPSYALSDGLSTSDAFIAFLIEASCISIGSSDSKSVQAVVILKLSRLTPPKKILMKQRIHNSLAALVRQGPYYSCTVNSKTGQMTIDLDKPITPKHVKVAETQTSYRLARRLKSEFGASELESWSWITRVEFPGLEVACEVFEQSVVDTGIQIPPVVGLTNQRSLLARLVRADYSHPPDQSPNQGTVAEFSFEILPETLRK